MKYNRLFYKDLPFTPVRPIKLMTVDSALAGTVRATDRVDLAFQVDGSLIKLPVKEGINPEEVIATSGVSKLQEGQVV